MPFEFACPNCSANLRIDDEHVGKSIRCPACQTTILIPSANIVVNGEQPPDNQQNEDAPLNPYSGSTSTVPPYQNPYQSPTYIDPHDSDRGNAFAPEPDTPTTIEIGSVFQHAWARWRDNLGLLIGTTCFILGVTITGGVIEGVLTEFDNSLLLAKLTSWGTTAIETFVEIGMAKICLALCRNQRADFSMLFSGGDKLLPVIGMSILYGLAVLLGLVLLIIPGIIISLLLWPYYYYIVDNQCPALESFRRAIAVGKINKSNSFALSLLSLGIILLGLLALVIGVVLALPLIQMMLATAYLMMKGELKPVEA